MAADPGSSRPSTPGAGLDRDWEVPWTWVDGVLAFVAGLLVAELLRTLFALVRPGDPLAAVLSGGLGLIAGVVGWLAVRHPRALRLVLGPGPLRLRSVLAGLVHGLVAFLVLNIGAALLYTFAAEAFGVDVPTVQESLRETITDPDFAVVAIVYTLTIAVVAEELYFRGVLFPALRGPLGVWPAIGVTGLVFGLVHWQPDLVAFLYTVTVLSAFGMYLAWAFDRHRHLVVPLLMHAVFNGLTVVAIVGD